MIPLLTWLSPSAIVQHTGRVGITSERAGSTQGAISEDSRGVSGRVDVFRPGFT